MLELFKAGDEALRDMHRDASSKLEVFPYDPMSDVTVDIEVIARVSIERSDLYEHQKEMVELADNFPAQVDCECWKEDATEKQIAECLAFQKYLNEKETIDLSWQGCEARCPNVPLEPLEDD